VKTHTTKSRLVLALSGLLLSLAAANGCSATTGLTLDAAESPQVIPETAQPGNNIKERFYILDGNALSAVKTYYKDGTHELRYFRPDRTAFTRQYKGGKLLRESEYDEEGKLVRSRSYKYRLDGTLDQVRLPDGSITHYSSDGQTKLLELDSPFDPPLPENKLDDQSALPHSSEFELGAASNRLDTPSGGALSGLIRVPGQVLSFLLDPLSQATTSVKSLRYSARCIHADLTSRGSDAPHINCKTCPTGPGDYQVTLPIGGLARECLLHLPPAYDGKRKLPLVIVLHGSFIDNEYMVRLTRMNYKADAEGFIVAYPNATGWFGKHVRCWNVGKSPLYRTDDLHFLSKLIDTSIALLSADPSRIYVAGFSMGAAMAHEVGIELSDKVAAIASVSGWLTGNERKPPRTMPVLMIHGTADFVVPYCGRSGLSTTLLPYMQPVAYARSFWSFHNRCTRATISMKSARVLKETHTTTDGSVAVVQYTVFGGEHAWPGSYFRNLAGEPSREFDATEAIWQFFSGYKLQGALSTLNSSKHPRSFGNVA
jgi:polyhydroxybutyrate depolymerase